MHSEYARDCWYSDWPDDAAGREEPLPQAAASSRVPASTPARRSRGPGPPACPSARTHRAGSAAPPPAACGGAAPAAWPPASVLLITSCPLSLRAWLVLLAGLLRGLELRGIRVDATAGAHEAAAGRVDDGVGKAGDPVRAHARGQLQQLRAKRADLRHGKRELGGPKLPAGLQCGLPARAALLLQNLRSDLVSDLVVVDAAGYHRRVGPERRAVIAHALRVRQEL